MFILHGIKATNFKKLFILKDIKLLRMEYKVKYINSIEITATV